MVSESCVVWTATWVMIPINVVSSPLPSSLLYFLFVTSFLKRFSLCHFPMSIFHKIENTFEKMITQYLLFVVKKNFVCALYCWNLSSFDSFVDFSKKQISIRHFLPNVVKKKSCVEIFSFAIFSSKKIWQKQSFFFSGGSSFSHFSILFLSRRAFLQTIKKPDSLYFSLYCFCLICCLFRVVSLCLLSLLLLF